MSKRSTNKSAQDAFERLHKKSVSARSDKSSNQRIHITIGTATCGRASGALEPLQTFKDEIARKNIDATITEVGCRGYCYAEPMVVISKPGYPPICYGYVTPGVAERLVNDFILDNDPCLEFALGALEENDQIPAIFDQPRFKYEKRNLLRNCGKIDPDDIEQYISSGGYGALAKALDTTPQRIIDEIGKSGLRGLGGAGFPVADKWQMCHDTPSDMRYVICNADEGDPGAFMDRTILESDPFSIVEGMTIAAYAIGSTKGYVYVREEYPLAAKRIESAIQHARAKKLLGGDILSTGFDFDIDVFQGAGAFVCGEATALIASLEGKRGWPRPRPPRTAVQGLWDKPTLINNVKTLAYVPLVIERGAAWLASIGTNYSKGTAVFALAGKVRNTGLTEVPMGTTLRHIVYDIGGGIPNGRKFKAVQIGGPSGGCLPEQLLDLPVDFDSLEHAGGMMGSGGMVILDEDNCMVETARYFLEFTRNESCGKCTFCRLGTVQMLDILDDITRGKSKMDDLSLIEELAKDIKEGSLCGLGQSAPNPILTTLRYFKEEYEAHIIEKRCPAKVCPGLTATYIVPEKCERSCDACVGTCPTEAIFTGKSGIKVIDQGKCVKCDTCIAACPPQYKAVIKITPLSELPPLERRPATKGSNDR